MQHSFAAIMSSSSSRPAISLSKVPSVKELCERLGFQYASIKETNLFMETTRAWRKSYITGSGRPATDLLHWNEALDQLELEEMAEKFVDVVVDDSKNGDRFWSPIRSWNHDSDLKFPEDRSRIVDLLKQLFWKQNRYAYNNRHYGHKETESQDTTRDNTTPIRQTGPEIHSAPSMADVSVQNDGGGIQAKSISPRNMSSRATGVKHVTHTFDASSKEYNVYEIPSDSDSYQKPTSTPRSHKRPHSNTGAAPPKKKKKQQEKQSPRRTERKRVVRNIPDSVPIEEVDNIIDSPDDTTSGPVPSTQTSPIQSTRTPTGVDLPALPSSPLTPKRYAPTALMIDKRKNISPQSKTSMTARAANRPQGIEKSASSSSPSNSSSTANKPKTSEAVTRLPTKVLSETEKNNPKISRPSSYTSPYVEDSPLISPITQNSSTLATPGEPKDGRSLQRSSKASDPIPSTANSTREPSTSSKDTSQIIDEIRQDFNTHMDDRISKERMAEPILATPSPTIAPPPQKEKTDSSRSSLSQPPPSKPRQKTQIPLWIITREPRYTEERWDDGKFMGTPLPLFIEGISKVTGRGHIEKVKLTLRAPTFDTKLTVFSDAEDSWASAKDTFVEKLKEAKAEARAKRQEQVTFKILIEPCYKEGFLPSGSIDEDEEEYDF